MCNYFPSACFLIQALCYNPVMSECIPIVFFSLCMCCEMSLLYVPWVFTSLYELICILPVLLVIIPSVFFTVFFLTLPVHFECACESAYLNNKSA